LNSADGLSISVKLGAQSMGGFGGGRPAIHVACEDCLKLDLASPATRKALTPHAWTTGTWHWSSRGREVGSIGYAWRGSEARLILNYACNGSPVSQTITLTSSTPQFGGKRWWFVCPFTGARVRALFLPPGARLWGSRGAYGLVYQSQREGGSDRAVLRMLAKAGRWPGDPNLAAAHEDVRDPFGFREERRWQRREEARKRRNEVRRIARGRGGGASPNSERRKG
jgi:hypothetical protein